MNEINFLANYAKGEFFAMRFRSACTLTFSLLINARNKYRQECKATGIVRLSRPSVRSQMIVVAAAFRVRACCAVLCGWQPRVSRTERRVVLTVVRCQNVCC